VDESKDVKFAFYYENNVLKRKWESKDGYKRGNQIVLPKPLRKAVLEYPFLMSSDIYHNYDSVLSHLQRHPANKKTEVPSVYIFRVK
jgi:hypothetical protein